jgi:hypothetical protein
VKGVKMYTIQVVLRCPDEQSEIHSSLLDDAECIIEERIGLALLELFGTVLVDCVNVKYTSLQNERGDAFPPTV